MRILIFAAHPDDEVLGMGAQLKNYQIKTKYICVLFLKVQQLNILMKK